MIYRNLKVPRLLATIVATTLNHVTSPRPKERPHIDRTRSESLGTSISLLTLELNPFVNPFILTSSYFPSVHLLHTIVATQAV